MPWRQTDPVLERTRFVLEAERSGIALSELCRRYGISRPTGYQWIRRYQAEGPGLRPRPDLLARLPGPSWTRAPNLARCTTGSRPAHRARARPDPRLPAYDTLPASEGGEGRSGRG